MDVGAGNVADHVVLADRHGRRLVGRTRIAQQPLDEEVHDRDGDIGQQQRRDRLVDAARMAQPAGDGDPAPAGDHPGRRHQRSWSADRRAAGDQRNGDGRGGETAEHQRALGADHRQADLGGDGEGKARSGSAARSAAACSGRKTRCRSRRATAARRNRPATCRGPGGRSKTATPEAISAPSGITTFSAAARHRALSEPLIADVGRNCRHLPPASMKGKAGAARTAPVGLIR